MEKNLKCTCGTCNVCKTRIRMREQRVRKSGMLSKIPSLSGPAAGPGSWTDNIGIWIEGADHFDELVQDRIDRLRNDIRAVEAEIRSYSKKTRPDTKNLYWYKWVDGRWKYIGTVNGNNDPRAPLYPRIEEIRKRMEETEYNMRSCVLKQVEGDYNNHLVINIDLFNKHVRSRLPGGMFWLSEILKPTGDDHVKIGIGGGDV